MALNPELLDLLACPVCRGELEPVDNESGLECSACGLVFPVRDNIPIMLQEEAVRKDGLGSRTAEIVPLTRKACSTGACFFCARPPSGFPLKRSAFKAHSAEGRPSDRIAPHCGRRATTVAFQLLKLKPLQTDRGGTRSPAGLFQQSRSGPGYRNETDPPAADGSSFFRRAKGAHQSL